MICGAGSGLVGRLEVGRSWWVDIEPFVGEDPLPVLVQHGYADVAAAGLAGVPVDGDDRQWRESVLFAVGVDGVEESADERDAVVVQDFGQGMVGDGPAVVGVGGEDLPDLEGSLIFGGLYAEPSDCGGGLWGSGHVILHFVRRVRGVRGRPVGAVASWINCIWSSGFSVGRISYQRTAVSRWARWMVLDGRMWP